MMDRRAFIYSSLLHVGIGLLLFLGMPAQKPQINPLRPLPVKIVPIGILTQSPKVAVVRKTKIKKPSPSAPQKKGVPPQKEKVQAENKTPPPAYKSVSHETKSLPQKQSTPRDTAFQDVLSAVESLPQERGVKKKDAFSSDLISDKVSVSELDALRQQIQGCWLVPPGVLVEKDLIVEVGVHLDVSAKIQKIKILNTPSPQKKAVFNVAVQSIRQALKAPECTPLRVPLDKYHMWKYCVLRFSPRGIG